MFSSDITEAFAQQQERDLRERAAAARLAHAVSRRPSAATPQRQHSPWQHSPRRHHSWPHPLVAFSTWLAAGQL